MRINHSLFIWNFIPLKTPQYPRTSDTMITKYNKKAVGIVNKMVIVALLNPFFPNCDKSFPQNISNNATVRL